MDDSGDSKDRGGNVIVFPNREDVFNTFMANLIESKDANRVNNIVIGYTVPSDRPGIRNDVRVYWFGEDSSYYILGMVDSIKRKIHKWIDEVDEDTGP